MWYCVSVVFQRFHPKELGPSEHTPLWEESFILVDAQTEEEAVSKGAIFAKKQEVTFDAVTGEQVDWRFEGVTGTFEILDQPLKDGSEIFSRFLTLQPPTQDG